MIYLVLRVLGSKICSPVLDNLTVMLLLDFTVIPLVMLDGIYWYLMS